MNQRFEKLNAALTRLNSKRLDACIHSINEYLNAEYKQIATDPVAYLDNGAEVRPVTTLADDAGGRAIIIEDDGCYVLCIEKDGKYGMTSWIFPEAFEVLKTLPPLR